MVSQVRKSKPEYALIAQSVEHAAVNQWLYPSGAHPVRVWKRGEKWLQLHSKVDTFLGSSMVEHPAVNRRVTGSSPVRGAKKPLKTLRFQGFLPFYSFFPDTKNLVSGFFEKYLESNFGSPFIKAPHCSFEVNF